MYNTVQCLRNIAVRIYHIAEDAERTHFVAQNYGTSCCRWSNYLRSNVTAHIAPTGFVQRTVHAQLNHQLQK